MPSKPQIVSIFFVLALSILTGNSHAEAPTVLWEKFYGGSGSDKFWSVQQTSDQGFIAAGATDSHGAGNFDFYLVKTDAAGDIIWTRTYGGPDEDIAYSVRQTTDGGYILTGSTFSYGAGTNDVYLVKTDAVGDTLWTRTFGDENSDHGRAVRQTTDGGYIISGSSKPNGSTISRFYIIKTDAAANTLWTRLYGEGNHTYGHKLEELPGGGYAAVGMIYPSAAVNRQAYLLNLTAAGDTLWTRTYGGPTIEWGYGLGCTDDGGYIMTGYALTDNPDLYLIRADADGDTLWTRTFGGQGSDVGFSVEECVDNGYILAGWTESYGAGGEDLLVIKYSAEGDPLWTLTFGTSGYDKAYYVQQTCDTGYVVAGYQWKSQNGYDACLIKIDANSSSSSDLPVANDFKLGEFSPNPFCGSTRIEFDLPDEKRVHAAFYDATGRMVKTVLNGRHPGGPARVDWNGIGSRGNSAAPGIYFLRLTVDDQTAVRRVLLYR